MTRLLTDLLAEQSILLDCSASDRDDAVRQAGLALLAAGAVDEAYLENMLLREHSISTYIGEGVAIPHGTISGQGTVLHDALTLLRFPDGIDWDGNRVQVVIGIAAKGRGYIPLLSLLASLLLEGDRAQTLRSATTTAEVYRALSGS